MDYSRNRKRLPTKQIVQKKGKKGYNTISKSLVIIIILFLAINILTGFILNSDTGYNNHINSIIKNNSKVFYTDYFFLKVPCLPKKSGEEILLDESGQQVCSSIISYNVLFYGNISYLIGYYPPLIISLMIIIYILKIFGLFNFLDIKVESRTILLVSMISIIIGSLLEIILMESKLPINYIGKTVIYYLNICTGSSNMSKIFIAIALAIIVILYISEYITIPKIKFNLDLKKLKLPNLSNKEDIENENFEDFIENSDDFTPHREETRFNKSVKVPIQSNDIDLNKKKVTFNIVNNITDDIIKDKVDNVIERIQSLAKNTNVILSKIVINEKPRLIEYNVHTESFQKQNKDFALQVKLLGNSSIESDNCYTIYTNRFEKDELNRAKRGGTINQLMKPDFSTFLSMLDKLPASSVANQMLFSPGIDIHGNLMMLDALDCVHIGICGSTTSGKTNTILTALSSLHYLNNPNTFEVWIADPTKILTGMFGSYVARSAEGEEKSADLLRDILEVISIRNDILSTNKVTSILELPPDKKPPIIIFVTDELQFLFNNSAELSTLLSNLASSIATGSKVGVYFWLGTQLLTKSTTGSNIFGNLQTKFVHWLSADIDVMTAWSNASMAKVGNATKLQGFGDFYCGQNSGIVQRGHSIYVPSTSVIQLFDTIKEKTKCDQLTLVPTLEKHV